MWFATYQAMNGVRTALQIVPRMHTQWDCIPAENWDMSTAFVARNVVGTRAFSVPQSNRVHRLKTFHT
jgi:hypothetical protein